MVFGAVERESGRHRRCHVLGPVLSAVATDVDVQSVFADVVTELAPGVVIVPDDLAPVVFDAVLQLDDEPGNVPTVVRVPGRTRVASDRRLVYSRGPLSSSTICGVRGRGIVRKGQDHCGGAVTATVVAPARGRAGRASGGRALKERIMRGYSEREMVIDAPLWG